MTRYDDIPTDRKAREKFWDDKIKENPDYEKAMYSDMAYISILKYKNAPIAKNSIEAVKKRAEDDYNTVMNTELLANNSNKAKQNGEIRKTSDMENKNRGISLPKDFFKLPSNNQDQATDETATNEIDNRLGIRTNKKLVEYGQEVVDKMNRKNVNLNVDNTLQQGISETLRTLTNPVQKPKSEIEKSTDNAKNLYDKSLMYLKKKGDKYYIGIKGEF